MQPAAKIYCLAQGPVYMYNWISLLCTRNIVSQLYFSKINILRKKIEERKKNYIIVIFHKLKVVGYFVCFFFFFHSDLHAPVFGT